MLLSLCLLLFFAVAARAQKNTLSIPDVTVAQGGTIALPVQLENTADIVAVQFTLSVPNGVTLETETAQLSERSNGHSLTFRAVGNNKYMAMLFSSQNNAVVGRSGKLLSVQLRASNLLREGEVLPLQLSDVAIADKTGRNLATGFSAGQLTIAKMPDLEVTNVTTEASRLVPGQSLSVKWKVSNVGGLPTKNGWTEQIFLEDASGRSKLVGTAENSASLAASASVSRSADFVLPKELGLSQDARLRVKIKPYSDAGEPSWLQANNEASSDKYLSVSKLLYLSPEEAFVEEASNPTVRLKLTRSGQTATEETFSLTATADSRVALPQSVTIPQGQSGIYFYARLSANNQLDTDSLVALTLSGNGYETVSATLHVTDDRFPALSIRSDQEDVTEGGTIVFHVSAQRSPKTDVSVKLACDAPARFSIPSGLVLRAGTTSLDVTVSAVEDDIPDVEKAIAFSVSAEGYESASMLTTLVDNDLPNLELQLSPSAISEGEGPLAVSAVLKRMSNIDKKVTIVLSDDAEGSIYYGRKTIEMPAGVEQVTVNLGPIDNTIVDGERTVNITAAVYIASCSCNASAGTAGGSVTAPLVIYDNDGPTLTLTSSQSVLKEGGEMQLTISRNTSATTALTVKLTNDHPAQLEMPTEVTIPVGKTAETFLVKSKSNTTAGDDFTAVITAEAPNFAKANAWFSVTDQNMPDAQIVDISVDSTNVLAGQSVKVKLVVKNAGLYTLPEQTKLNMYLSNSNTAAATAFLKNDLVIGDTVSIVREVVMPSAVGTYRLYAAINEGREVKELNYNNNSSNVVTMHTVSPYAFTLSVDKSIYKQEEEVKISGRTTGLSVANKQINVYIVNNGYRHVLNVVTDASGLFSATYKPYSGQMGHFVVGACYPGEKTETALASFDIYGVKRVSNAAITIETDLGDTSKGAFAIVNPGQLSLSGVSVSVLSKPQGCEVKVQSPTSLAGGAQADISYEVKPSIISPERTWEKVELLVKANEEVSLPVTLYYYCRSLRGKLQASVSSINTTMIKGETRDYPFTIANVGKGETGKISLSLPSWMKSATSIEMPSLSKDGTAEVILRLTPTSDMQLNNPVPGRIGINCESGEGLSLPFSIEPVSTSLGTLTIDVCDEYTYNTKEAPHLSGAYVMVKHPTTGALIVSGTTNENGIFSTTIPEGYYAVAVSAEKHTSYSNNLLVDPGKDNKTIVNLSYQAITIDWRVDETTIEDQYDIKTDVKYETSVPVPVVVLSIPSSISAGDLKSGESLIFYATLTNKGLITAEDVQLVMPSDFKTLTFEALSHADPFSLAPQQSVQVPVKVTKVAASASARRSLQTRNLDNDPCASQVGTLYFWDCGLDRKWHRYGVALQVGSCKSKDPEVWETPSNDNGTIGDGSNISGSINTPGWRPSGGISSPGYVGVTNPPSMITKRDDKGCEPCQNGFIIAGAKCAGHFIGDAVETLKALCGIESDEEDEEKSNLQGLLKDIAQSFDGCVNGKQDIDQVLDCYDAASKSVDLLFDASVTAALGHLIPAEDLAKYKSIGKKMLRYKKWVDIAAQCARDFAHACDHVNNDTIGGVTGSFSSKLHRSSNINSAKTLLESATDGMSVYADYLQAFSTLNNIFFGAEEAWNEMSIEEQAKLMSIDYETMSYEDALQYKPNDLPLSLFRSYYDKHKKWAEGDYSNLLQSDRDGVLESINAIDYCFEYFKEEGYEDPVDFLNTTFKDAWTEVNKPSTGVCASITLQFSQQMVMTRQAFRGTLTVFNGNETNAMKDVKLNLMVTDEDGNVAMSDKFQINPEKLEGFTGNLSFEEGWMLDAKQTGVATVLFIPTKNAAPTVSKAYAFGGTLTYVDAFTGLEVTRTLAPITLTVKPSPNLNLTYFMQRDVLGDDPLTEEVEPSQESEFALLINNVGYGDATNVRMTTNQPQIVDNEKGLDIQFELMSSKLNGKDKVLAMGKSIATDFGDIPAGKTAYAQWLLKSSLLGHFTDYKVEANHLTSYGNEDLSLLNEVTIHELIRSVEAESEDSTLTAFLTNDIVDADDTPDMLYLTNGKVETVCRVSSTLIEKVSPTEWRMTILPSSEGWNYGNVSDPTYGVAALKSVVRQSDGRTMSLRNFWQTERTLRDGKDPLYENRIHFVDNFASSTAETYLLTFETMPDLQLAVASIEGVPQENEVATQPVEALNVMFNKHIDASSFTDDDIRLTVQGKEQDSSLIDIQTDDNKTFKLSFNRLNAQAGNGYYSLTIQTANIMDAEGYCGKAGTTVGWTMFKGGKVELTTVVSPLQAGTIISDRASVDSFAADYGNALKLKARPSEGYEFSSWTLNGETLSTDSSLAYVPTSDAQLTANFTLKNYRVDVEESLLGGYIDGTQSGIYPYGESVQFTAVATTDFAFDHWVVDGKTLPEAASDTLKLIVRGDQKVSAMFRQELFQQKLTLHKGWNWVSTYLKDTIPTYSVLSNATSIVGPSTDVNVLQPATSYKVKVATAYASYAKGHLYDTAQPIALKEGLNYLGYPCQHSASTAEALPQAEEGDAVIGKTGFALYADGQWIGSLTTLVPGEGYLYKSTKAKQIKFEPASEDVEDVPAKIASNASVVDASTYPDVMGFVAQVLASGEQTASERFTIYAMVGGECRGVSQLKDNIYYLTVYGNRAEQLSFIIEDHTTGKQLVATEQTAFSEDVVGTPSIPYIFNHDVATSTIDWRIAEEGLTIYSIEGYLLYTHATLNTLKQLPKGVYIINGRKYIIR